MDGLGCGVQLKHFAKPCLLLPLQERPDYGYDLVTRLRALGVEDDSAAYRALRSLEADGAVTSHWKEPVAGPARRMYQVTPVGSVLLGDGAELLDESRRALDGSLTRYRQCRPRLGAEPAALRPPAADRRAVP
jgi:DNA-binding PadR family transcriptional regulator